MESMGIHPEIISRFFVSLGRCRVLGSTNSLGPLICAYRNAYQRFLEEITMSKPWLTVTYILVSAAVLFVSMTYFMMY